MKTNRIPPNTPQLQALKNEGWSLRIKHYRQLEHISGSKSRRLIAPDMEWREDFEKDFKNAKYFWHDLSPTGGATEMTFQRGEEKITVRADVYHKDHFCRRTGVKVCLEKFVKIQSQK